MKLKQKVPLLITIPTIVIALAASAVSYVRATDALQYQRDTAFDFLIEERVERLVEWLDSVETDLLVLGAGRAVQDAIVQFTTSWNDLGNDPSGWLQKHYISENPNPIGQKDALKKAEDGSAWTENHAKFHDGFRTFQIDRGYYDLFLFDTKGNLIYSVFKEADFATNFVNGEFAQSGLGFVFQKANEASPEQTVFSEMSPYAPSADAPAQFVAMPIFGDTGQRIGVVALQIPVDERVSNILSGSELLGSTGIVFVVDAEGHALSSSPREGGFEMFDTLPDLPHLLQARNGMTVSVEGNIGLSGKSVVARAMPLVREGGDWNVVLEQDMSEAYAEQNALFWFTVAQVVLTVILVTFVGCFVARMLTKRIESLVQSVKRIADGDFETDVAQSTSGDELGEIGQSLEVFKADLKQGHEAMLEREIQAKDQAFAMNLLGTALQKLASGNLESHIQVPLAQNYETIRDDYNQTVDALASLVEELQGGVHAIDRTSTTLSKNAENLAKRTENQAAALEETTAAVEEITKSVQSAADGSKRAVSAVESANTHANRGQDVRTRTVEAMTAIETSANQISMIIQVIEDIAFQTNLLALNAGVEAARAGSAGSGFAVVAAEVLALAHRSSDSASEIRDLIALSNENVNNGGILVSEMGEAIDNIMKEVSKAAEMSRDISSGSSEQASSLSEINSSMTMLDQVTQQNAEIVSNTAEALREMQIKTTQLQTLVSRFKKPSIDQGDNLDMQRPSAENPEISVLNQPAKGTDEWEDIPDLSVSDQALSGSFEQTRRSA